MNKFLRIFKKPEDWFAQAHKKLIQDKKGDGLVNKHLTVLDAAEWFRALNQPLQNKVRDHFRTKLHEEVSRAGTIAEYSYTRAALQRGAIAAAVTLVVMTFLAFALAGFTFGLSLLVPIVGAIVAFGLVVGTAYINYEKRIEGGVKSTYDLLVKNKDTIIRDIEQQDRTKQFQGELSQIMDKRTFVERLFEERSRLNLPVAARAA